MYRNSRRQAPLPSQASARWLSHPPRPLADLNLSQRQAVLHTEGPLLVVAGAGSGKTRVLTHRVAHLIAAVGVQPNEILVITFTNKAAGEMAARLEDLLPRGARRIWILTFYAAVGGSCGAKRRGSATRRTSRSTTKQTRSIAVIKQAWRSRARPEAVPGQGHPRAHLERQEPADRPGRVPHPRRLLLRPDRRRGLRPLPTQTVRRERRRLRRPADATVDCPSVSRRPRSAGRRRSAPLRRRSTRTRITRSTGCSRSWLEKHRNVCVVGDYISAWSLERYQMSDGDQQHRAGPVSGRSARVFEVVSLRLHQ